jgi:hypothetical protein
VSESWEFYECVIDDERAFVALDLAFHEAGPDPERPVTVRVTVPLESPRADGLPSSEERPRLDAIEDALRTEFQKAGAVQVGRVSFGGAVRHFFYARSEDDARIVSARCAELVDDRELEVGGYLDPEWEQYFEFLYPNELGWQYINDRRVIDTLREHGDALEAPRQIDHTAFFPSSAARETFRAAIAERGFRIDGSDAPEAGAGEDAGDEVEMPYALRFSHELAPLDIFPVTVELVTLAGEQGGSYDGWGCPVVSAS